MKKTKLVAAIAAAAMAVTSMAATSISASAYSYNDYYDTYRIYAELAPASGLYACNVTMSYPRSTYSYVKLGNSTIGNLEGTYSVAGTANDSWVTHVDIFRTKENGDVTNGGTLYKWDFYTKIAATSAWEIFCSPNTPGITVWDSNNNVISNSCISIYAVKVGDVNQDGVVDWSDVSVLNNQNIGSVHLSNNALRAADTNNDGYVTTADLNTLISYLSGNIEHF